MPTDLFELTFAEARRNLDAQRGDLDALRGRAGTLLSAVALSTSFFGGLTLTGDGSLTAASWVAFAAFLVASGLIVAILWPRAGWKFTVDPPAIVSEFAAMDPPASMPEVLHSLTLDLHESAVANRERLDRMLATFQWATVALIVEVAAWLVALGGR